MNPAPPQEGRAGGLRVGLLGSLVVGAGGPGEADGVGLPSATQRRLMSILALEAGHVLPADRLCDLLGASPGSLRTIVSRLRATVGVDHLRTSAPGYVLRATTDIAEFEGLVARAGTTGPAATIDLLDGALALWRGEAIEEFRQERWAVAAVARLDELRAGAIEAAALARLAVGQAERAIAGMRSHILRYPLRERPRALLMRGLAAEGRTTEALQAFEEFRRYLAEHTGTEPSHALRRLEHALAEGADGSG